ncbi:MAG: hypothetical protein IT269_01225 [Saprospiraceae bacterium]|nr:hypothetical protein [Saprospiraceae bacterium]
MTEFSEHMVARQDIDSCSCHITVTINRDELKPKLDAELKRFRQRMPIKGFRQGQAPMDFVKKLYGSSIFSETLNEMLSERLYDYLQNEKIQVLGQPLPVDEQEAFSFKISNPDPEYRVKYEVGFVPEFDISGLDKASSYERLTISNLDELAEEDLNYARKRMGKRANPENDIQDNDIVRIAARELDGDAIKEGGWETSMSTLVKNIVDEQLKAQILTLKKGDTLRFNARHLENQEKESFFRKYILNVPDNDQRPIGDMFEGVIEEVNRVTDADMDDEFFNNYFGGGVSSKDEAIDKLKDGIRQYYGEQSDALLMREFQERLLAANRFELPAAFIGRWLTLTNRDKLTPEQVQIALPAFLENLRWSILRDALKQKLGVEITEADLMEHYSKQIRSYFGGQVDDMFIATMAERMVKDKKENEKVESEIEWDKLAQAIKQEVTVVDKPIPSKEFQAIIEEISQKAKAERAESESLTESL